MRSRRGVGAPTAQIPRSKVRQFKRMFDSIRMLVGNYDKTKKLIGLSAGQLDRLEKGILTTNGATKILNAYKEVIKTHGVNHNI